MRTLGKLKLIAVSAALVLGMSSCLKNDKKFAIYASPAYILQEGNSYQLQIQVQGNEQIKSASASLNGKNYSFSAVEGSQNFLKLSVLKVLQRLLLIAKNLLCVAILFAENAATVFLHIESELSGLLLTAAKSRTKVPV